MQQLTPAQLQQWLDESAELLLIDVREPFEHDRFNIGGELLPLAEVPAIFSKLPLDRPVVFYCEKGVRSQIAIQRLQDKFPFQNLFNLSGGLAAWVKTFPQS
jgi:rhodanese-related sulfurtransferase